MFQNRWGIVPEKPPTNWRDDSEKSQDAATFRVGGERVDLGQAAARATETLREIVKYFLLRPTAEYQKSEFWDLGYFGLPRHSNRVDK